MQAMATISVVEPAWTDCNGATLGVGVFSGTFSWYMLYRTSVCHAWLVEVLRDSAMGLLCAQMATHSPTVEFVYDLLRELARYY